MSLQGGFVATLAVTAILCFVSQTAALRSFGVISDLPQESGSSLRADGGEDNADLLFDFDAFKARFSRNYRSKGEEAHRLTVFAANWRLIRVHNAANAGWKMGINEFADLTWQEFRQLMLGNPQNCSAQKGGNHVLRSASEQLPTQRDWRDAGIVSPVKNQGHCGSCWTFSTTGALEAAYTQKTGKSGNFSEQQLVDCAGAFGNFGCNGGLPSQAFEYIHYNGGLDTEAAYPYAGKDETCHFSEKGVGVTVEGVVNITQYDEAELQDAVGLVRPVSVAFEVVSDFRFYKTGVYQSTNCKNGPNDVNHAVLAVGYNTASEAAHWIIKNSWGADWGEAGYFKMKLGVNMCGIATCASYPVV